MADDRTNSRAAVLKSTEGRILLGGLLLAMIYIVFLLISYFVMPHEFHVFAGMTVTHLFFGRAAGMSFGYALDHGHLTVIPINFAIEVILVMLIYPLFVFSLRKLLVVQSIENFMHRIRDAAERNRDLIRRYGIPGLFLFVCIPFWMTGPVVGSVIGFFLGLKAWVNISVVLSGTLLASLGWAALLKHLHNRVEELHSFAPLLLLLVIILVAVAGLILDARRRHNNHR